MGTAERRNEILKILCRRRHETIHNLASEFGVSERTIRRDIEALSISEPIYTQSGRYNGGVYIMDGDSMDRMYMSDTEIGVLQKLYRMVDKHPTTLTFGEKEVLNTIISLYSKPKIRKEKFYEPK